jgi:hypothetical protein
MFSSLLVGKIMLKFKNKNLIFIGLIVGSICYIMMGPDPLTGIKPSLIILIICYFFLGLVSSLVFIPTMPEFIDDIAKMYPNNPEE